MRWIIAGFATAFVERNIVVSARTEWQPGAESDPSEWNWNVRAIHQQTLKSYDKRGAAVDEAAAKAAVERVVAEIVAKHGTEVTP